MNCDVIVSSDRACASRRRRFNRHLLAIAASSSFLSACASFSGAPEPVISVAQANAMIAGDLPDAVIQRMATKSPDERTIERNRVLKAYVTAADARYFEFRKNLSWDVKATNVGLDIAILALTGTASVWGGAAKALSAGATGLGGTRATLAKELYFDKTLPALISMMNSSRLEVMTDITRGLQKPETEYTIEEGFSDITRYQEAGSIDTAIQQVAAAAAAQQAAAQLDYSKAERLCTVPAAVAQDRRVIMYGLEDLVDPTKRTPEQLITGRKLVQQAAIAGGISNAALTTDEKGTTDQLALISDYLLSLCAAGPVATFKQTLEAKGVTFNG
jgi:hypothetical protein